MVLRVAFAAEAADNVRREAGNLKPPVDSTRGPSGTGNGSRGRLHIPQAGGVDNDCVVTRGRPPPTFAGS